MSGSAHRLLHDARNAQHLTAIQWGQDVEWSPDAIAERSAEPLPSQHSDETNTREGAWETLVRVQQCAIESARTFGMESVLTNRTSAGEH